MKVVLILGILVIALSGCQSTEVSSGDAQQFGQESEADRKAKADGTYSESREDR